MKYRVTLELHIEATDKNEAEGIGIGAFDHLYDTFNDNESIKPLYRIKAEEIKTK